MSVRTGRAIAAIATYKIFVLRCAAASCRRQHRERDRPTVQQIHCGSRGPLARPISPRLPPRLSFFPSIAYTRRSFFRSFDRASSSSILVLARARAAKRTHASEHAQTDVVRWLIRTNLRYYTIFRFMTGIIR